MLGSNGTVSRPGTLDAGRDAEIASLLARLYPVCRSITGPGVRQTLKILSDIHPIQAREVPTGTRVFDWAVPREWSIRDAYIKNASGRRIVDFQRHNLHVLNYSVPIEGRFTLDELRPHLYSLPNLPTAIPYRTSYYNDNWGFCLTHQQLQSLTEGMYEVKIDSTLSNGSLSIGEIVLKGEVEDEILVSTHTCHPSLANDNLSGMAAAVHLAKRMRERKLHHTFRFLFIPGTIGSITWLALNEAHVHRIKHALVITGVGDTGPFTYKRSRRGNAAIDRIAPRVLTEKGEAHKVVDFYPYGYDERQFCSPGFDLPCGRISRTPHGEYPEYHTSADNLDFVSIPSILRALDVIDSILVTADQDRFLVSRNPKCEPQLGKHGLYRRVAGQTGQQTDELAMLWVLSLADGAHSLQDMAERADMPLERIRVAADALMAHNLLSDGGTNDGPDPNPKSSRA